MPGHGSLASCMLLAFLPHLLQEPPHAQAQSGSSDVDDEPDLPRITCFSILANNAQDDRITCELAEPITDSEPFNVTFSEDQVTESCEINPRVTCSCSVVISKFALFSHCCIRVSKMDSPERSLCVHNKKIIHMVKPGPPFRVNVTVLMDAEEIELLWATPSVRFQELTKNLLHQVSYRTPESEWQLLNVTVCSVRLLMKHLIPNSKYMVRIRSIPDHDYFRGIWSDWSQTVTFKTPSSASSTLSTGVKLTISLLILLFFFLFGLSALFWENRIKPHIWPKVPNPKCALERIYMKPGKVGEVSFNPYIFLDVMVSRVDMIQIKGAQMCHRNLSAVCEAAEGNSNIERELLLSANPTVERAGNIRTSIPQIGSHTPQPHDKAVEPEGGARMCKGASGPSSCLSRGIQLRGRVGNHCNLLSPLTGDIPYGAAACMEESAQVTDRPTVRSANLGSNFPGSSVAPPDESYITMSNLYKIQ